MKTHGNQKQGIHSKRYKGTMHIWGIPWHRRWICIVLSSPTSSPQMITFLQSWKDFLDRQRFSYAECPTHLAAFTESSRHFGLEGVRLYSASWPSARDYWSAYTNRRPFPIWGSGSESPIEGHFLFEDQGRIHISMQHPLTGVISLILFLESMIAHTVIFTTPGRFDDGVEFVDLGVLFVCLGCKEKREVYKNMTPITPQDQTWMFF